MRIRLYFDEDGMDHDLVRALRARGVDVVTALDVGMVERPDREHLDYAGSQGRVLFSFNVGDYRRLDATYAAEGWVHTGILLARQQRHSVGDQMRRILRLVAEVPADKMRNRVEYLGSWGEL